MPFGTFGYELDITKLSQEDQDLIPQQVALYHQFIDLVREGDYYRIASYQENKLYDCWEIVSKDQSEALVNYVQVLGRPNCHSRRLRLQGLSAHAKYEVVGTDKIYDGDLLMYASTLADLTLTTEQIPMQ